MRALVESVAQALADLRIVDRSQWILRLGALAALLLADVLATGLHPLGNAAAVLVGAVILLLGLVQTLRPDSDIALVALCLLVLTAFIAGPLPLGMLLGLAALLMIAHLCWSLASAVPAYGVIRRGAARAHARSGLPALGIGLVAGAGLWLAAAGGLGVAAWMMIPGVLAVVVLLLLLVPREEPSPARR